MTHTALTAAGARSAIADAIRRIAPDADLDALGDDAPLRSELELDSLDFLAIVESLSDATGVSIDESDYPALTSMASAVAFLTTHSGSH